MGHRLIISFAVLPATFFSFVFLIGNMQTKLNGKISTLVSEVIWYLFFFKIEFKVL